MKLAAWLHSRLFRAQKTRRSKLNHHRRRPTLLERLEDRSLLAFVPVVPAATVVPVSYDNLNGWMLSTTDDGSPPDTASIGFMNGPATPPLPPGSGFLAVGANGASAAQFRTATYNSDQLASLTSLSYSTYVQHDGSGGQAPYIMLNVDYDSDGTTDDLLFFEPEYQSATFFPSNPQGPLTVGAWQNWDALHGGWWSVNGTAGANPGTDVKPLSAIIAAEPDAALATTSLGALRWVAGFGAGSWDNFAGNVDNVTVGVSSNNTTYDFGAPPPATVYVDDDWAATPIGADPDGAGPAQHFGWDSFATVQGGVNAVATAGTVIVNPGTYTENVNLNKQITLDGAGSGSDPSSDTIIKSAAANTPVMTVTAGGVDAMNRQVIRDIRVTGATGSGNAGSGILLQNNPSFLTFDNVTVTANGGHGIAIDSTGAMQDVEVLNSTLSNNGNGTDTGDGFRIPSSLASLDGLTINSSTLSGNVFGIEAYATKTNTTLNNISISDTSLSNNVLKGGYFERLNNASFQTINVNGNGTGSDHPAGFDINLKFATYSNLSINGAVFDNNGSGDPTGGVGLTIKGRGDSQDSSTYRSQPAHVSGVSLTNVSVSGSPIDMVFGDNVALGSVSMSGVSLSGAGRGLVLYENTDESSGQTLNVGNTSFDGAMSSYIEEGSPGTAVDATGAKFAGTAATALTTAETFAVVDKILDSVDVGATAAGFVRIEAGQVFITPNSFKAPVTTAPNIQRAVDAASAGDTAHVAPGTYTATSTVIINSKNLTIEGSGKGAGGTLITMPVGQGPTYLFELQGTANYFTLKSLKTDGVTQAAVRAESIEANPSGITSLGTLTVDNVAIFNSLGHGVSVDGGASGTRIQNVVITNSDFQGNGSNTNGALNFRGRAEVSLFSFNGNVTMNNVTMNGTTMRGNTPADSTASRGADFGFQLAGKGGGGGPWTTAGTISFTNVSVTGNYANANAAIQRFSTVPSAAFNNVSLAASVTGRYTKSAGSPPGVVQQGGLILDALPGGVSLAGFSVNIPGSSRPEAKQVNLGGDATGPISLIGTTIGGIAVNAGTTLSNLFNVADMVVDGVDIPGPSGAILRAGQIYVTPASFYNFVGIDNNVYGTTTPSIQRAVNVAPNAGTVNIKTGSYPGSVSTAGKAVTLSPGASPGVATLNGNLALDNNDTLAVDINGSTPGTDFDQLIVNGTVNLGGAALSATGTRAASDGQVLVLIQNDLSDAVVGTFNLLPEGSTIVVNGVTYEITYKYNAEASTFGNGNDVALIDISGSATPTPGTTNLVTDPCDPSKKALLIVGTDANDNIAVNGKGATQVEVKVDSGPLHVKQTFNNADITGRIIVYGMNGDDHVTINNNVKISAIIFGGAGKDDLHAGGASSAIVGDDGDDNIVGGNGRDILIGGLGKDHLQGQGGDDILIGGTTDFDASIVDLCLALDQWNAPSPSYNKFVGAVHDDAVTDNLEGAGGNDVYFANTTGTASAKDKINAQKGDNTVSVPPAAGPSSSAVILAAVKTSSTPVPTTTSPRKKKH